jgi:NAD-dependent SIR2 family protein deacetylase
VFLGAGASKAFGYPLTSEILPEIKKRVLTGELFGSGPSHRAAEAELDSYFSALLPGWEHDEIALPPITDVMSLIDHALLSNTSLLRGSGAPELTRFRKLVERGIYEVINDAYDGEPWPIRKKFIAWLLRDRENTGMITTNYDLEVDMGVFSKLKQKGDLPYLIDFGFDWREPSEDYLYRRPHDPDFRLYKLHGSLSWLRCDVCEHTYINLYGPIAHHAFKSKPRPENSCDCGHHILSLVLVAPSIVRDIRNSDILFTWKNALEWLRRADDWYIIGYSFPTEDLAIRSMFIRAYQGRDDADSKFPNVTVVQRGNDSALMSRFRILFPDCKWISGGLEAFLDGERA